MLRKELDLQAFDLFDNTEAVIIEKGNYDDYENKYDIIEKGVVYGDLQPYSGALLEKEYGFFKECQKCFFCGYNPYIKEGAVLRIGVLYYMIVYVENWGTGLEVMLKEMVFND